MNEFLKSDFLVAQPSLASGIARLVDFGCSFDNYNDSPTGNTADTRAMTSDWLNVGYDILDSVFEFEAEICESKAA